MGKVVDSKKLELTPFERSALSGDSRRDRVEVFSKLVERDLHKYARVVAFAHHQLDVDHEAAAQTALMNVQRRLVREPLRDPDRIRAYVGVAVRNAIIDELRARKNEVRVATGTDANAFGEDVENLEPVERAFEGVAVAEPSEDDDPHAGEATRDVAAAASAIGMSAVPHNDTIEIALTDEEFLTAQAEKVVLRAFHALGLTDRERALVESIYRNGAVQETYATIAARYGVSPSAICTQWSRLKPAILARLPSTISSILATYPRELRLAIMTRLGLPREDAR